MEGEGQDCRNGLNFDGGSEEAFANIYLPVFRLQVWSSQFGQPDDVVQNPVSFRLKAAAQGVQFVYVIQFVQDCLARERCPPAPHLSNSCFALRSPLRLALTSSSHFYIEIEPDVILYNSKHLLCCCSNSFKLALAGGRCPHTPPRSTTSYISALTFNCAFFYRTHHAPLFPGLSSLIFVVPHTSCTIYYLFTFPALYLCFY